MSEAAFQVENNPAAGRFEAVIDGQLAQAQYRRVGERILFTHTEVPEQLEGRGIASQLARAGLDFARAEGLTVVPLCPFIASYIERHPEYKDLVGH
jgi:predicted GNAT family acetyltransferase